MKYLFWLFLGITFFKSYGQSSDTLLINLIPNSNSTFMYDQSKQEFVVLLKNIDLEVSYNKQDSVIVEIRNINNELLFRSNFKVLDYLMPSNNFYSYNLNGEGWIGKNQANGNASLSFFCKFHEATLVSYTMIIKHDNRIFKYVL